MQVIEVRRSLYVASFLFFFLIIISSSSVSGSNQSELATIEETLDKITQGYNKKVRPNTNGIPVKVVASCYIIAIDQINDVKSDFMVKMYFRQSWNDPRLAYGKKFSGIIKEKRIRITGDMADDIWTPDTYVENQEGTNGKPFASIKLVHSGLVQLSVRWSIKANCPTMNLLKFPHDTQSCFLVISSFAYTVNELIYKWRNRDPIEVQESPIASQYMLIDTSTTVEQQYFLGANATWSYLKVEFVLRRKIAYYIIRIYLPALIVTLTSWISFWVDPKAIPARLSLCVITVLAMTTLSYNSQSMVPSVPYVKAVDVYLIMSFFFVFGALLVYAVILHRHSQQEKKKKEKKGDGKKSMEMKENTAAAAAAECGIINNCDEEGKRNGEMINQQQVITTNNEHCYSCWTLDTYSSVGFPVAYLLFHVLYFSLILT